MRSCSRVGPCLRTGHARLSAWRAHGRRGWWPRTPGCTPRPPASGQAVPDGGPYRRLDVPGQLRVDCGVPRPSAGHRLERVVLRAGGRADVHGLSAAEEASVEQQIHRALGADGVAQEPRAACPGCRPVWEKAAENLASNPATRKSQPRARLRPAPTSRPLDRGDGGDPQRLDHPERVVHTTEVVPDLGHGPGPVAKNHGQVGAPAERRAPPPPASVRWRRGLSRTAVTLRATGRRRCCPSWDRSGSPSAAHIGLDVHSVRGDSFT